MWQTKYASAVPKNLELGLNFRLCREGYFLSGRPWILVKITRLWQQQFHGSAEVCLVWTPSERDSSILSGDVAQCPYYGACYYQVVPYEWVFKDHGKPGAYKHS